MSRRPRAVRASIVGAGVLLVAAVTLTMALASSREDDERPLLRAGIASGEALPRAGDLYGRPVNLASRLTSFARRGSVVTSKEVHDAAREAYDWTQVGSRRVKGVRGEVEVYRARSLDTSTA